jgi:prepilin-type N-terminal cleavage/methylation domain-containing protein
MATFGKKNSLVRKYFFSSSQIVTNRGFSFIELIVTTAIMALVFGGLFSGYQTIISLISESRMKASALALVSERMEYIRSLPYNSIGTISGVPSGILPQTSTTTLNGATFVERILISFIDDPADGTAGSDTNLITSDYKLIKIEYAWTNKDGTTRSIFHTTNIVPQGIETTAGGGTIRVNVFDANLQPVSGAEVRFIQASSSINTPRYTGASGEAYLSGAPQGSDYQVFVTKPGYSSDSTYIATTTNPNPLTAPTSVVENQVSTLNFQIDELGSVTILTKEPAMLGEFEDQFADGSLVATSTSITITSSTARLLGAPGSYVNLGTLQSVFESPATLYEWTRITSNVNLPAGTTVRLFVYYDSVTPTLVPDTDLPGNSAGFTVNPIDISGLNPAIYPGLALGAVLETTDPNVTPELASWRIEYVVDRAPIANVPVRMVSQRTIGSDYTFSPIPKYAVSTTSDSDGELALPQMEWGIYTLTEESGSYIASEICPFTPFTLDPNEDQEIIVSLVPARSATLLVSVTEADGTPVPDATVTLEDGAFSDIQTTGLCGQVLFDTAGVSSTYTVTVQKSGFSNTVVNNVDVTTVGSLVGVVLQP